MTQSRMTPSPQTPHFLGEAPDTAAAQHLYAEDVDQVGFVMNGSRLWAHRPELHDQLFALIGQAARAAGLTMRQKGVLVAATAATLGDAYCSLAWGLKLSDASEPAVAVSVLTADDEQLTPDERALARWARQLVRDPNAVTPADLQPLRDAGFDDAQVLALTLYAALRLAFATVNDGLGARPDSELRSLVPEAVQRAAPSGRPFHEV